MPDVIEVDLDDLEAIYQTVATLHSFCLSQDLGNQFKTLATTVKRSPLTAMAKRAEDRLAGYIAEATRAEEEEAEDVPQE